MEITIMNMYAAIKLTGKGKGIIESEHASTVIMLTVQTNDGHSRYEV